jgi:hypothetical protein
MLRFVKWLLRKNGGERKRKKNAKAHRPASFVGRREVAGYETPVGFFESAEGARIERVTLLLLHTRISWGQGPGPKPAPPQIDHWPVWGGA